MNEAETRAELIDPALRDAGWGVVEGSRASLTRSFLPLYSSRGKMVVKDKLSHLR
jgi:Holliday junction resolvasome RuvABC endonuclease subunit